MTLSAVQTPSTDLENAVEAAWDARDTLSAATTGAHRDAVETALAMLDSGKARIAEKGDNGWHVNQWLKKAVLLGFRLQDMRQISGGADNGGWYDKSTANSKAGANKTLLMQVFALCQIVLSANLLISRQALF